MHTYTAHTFHVSWSTKSRGFIPYNRCSGIAIIWLKYCRYEVKQQTIIQSYTSSKPPKCATNVHLFIYIELSRSIIHWKAILSTDARLCHPFIQIPWNGPKIPYLHLPQENKCKMKNPIKCAVVLIKDLSRSTHITRKPISIPQSYEATQN